MSGEFRVSMLRSTGASLFSREGPLKRISAWKKDGGLPEEMPADQCIFINYHKMKSRRLWRSRAIRAAAGPHDFKYDSFSDDDASQVTLGSPDPMDEDYSHVHEVWLFSVG